ncbi:PIN domain-containing protein [Agromyces archimandritae]|uniref:PIN domain-containing protein n=2 Tax=Agromyces archimandritae TaxID=2781962 RepID=A0A975FR24_9MICO|nr:PIN domain-containing protein [Agromyces archimandritae]
MRPEPDLVVGWLNAQAADTLYISSVTLAELLFGIGALPAGARKERLAHALDGLLALFPGRVLAFDQESARRYAIMAVAARAAGTPLPTADGYIAAVATRNARDLAATGVELIDPWQEDAAADGEP